MKFLSFTTLIFFSISVSAQIKIGDNPKQIDSTSLLELESKTKGFLPPRMGNAEMNNISPHLTE